MCVPLHATRALFCGRKAILLPEVKCPSNQIKQTVLYKPNASYFQNALQIFYFANLRYYTFFSELYLMLIVISISPTLLPNSDKGHSLVWFSFFHILFQFLMNLQCTSVFGKETASNRLDRLIGSNRIWILDLRVQIPWCRLLEKWKGQSTIILTH